MKVKKQLLIGTLMILILTEAGILWGMPAIKNRAHPTLMKYAEQIVTRCASESYKPACYDKEIPKLMDTISLEDAFKVTGLVQAKDSSYQYCHVLGHELSAREVQKDPSRWKDVVTRCPSGMCSNGCLHGGFQERFRAESVSGTQLEFVKKDLMDLCEPRGKWSPTGLEQASCYHALGHLTMYITAADLRKSIAICDEITTKNNRPNHTQLCYDGVFMQIFQPLEPEDFALVKGKQPTKETVPSFCGAYAGKQQASCLSESWPLFAQELKTPRGLVNFCEMTPRQERARCYDVIEYVIPVQLNFALDRIQQYCSGLPDDKQGRCFANAASRMIETDYRNISKSTELCSSASSLPTQDACYKELVQYSTYNFHPGSAEALLLCQGLPGQWKTQCLSKN